VAFHAPSSQVNSSYPVSEQVGVNAPVHVTPGTFGGIAHSIALDERDGLTGGG
jgi:hypothetical protein